MKFFYPTLHYDKNFRRHLFALLKPFIKDEGFTDEDRIRAYGISEKDISFTDTIEHSDYCILTMSWLYYKMTKQDQKAIAFIEKANKLNKKVIVSLPSDFGIKIPNHLDVIILRAQGYRSKLNIFHQCVPVFIPDPLYKHYDSREVFERSYNKQPTVGFCGQADGGKAEALKEVAKIVARNWLYYLGIRYKKSHKIIASKYLRYRLIELLKRDKRIRSNFILRKKHRAGVELLKTRDTHKSTLDFFDNIKDSDYVICARGVGNFSVRLYETLAMGRIPVIIDTDCMLPHDTYFDWKKNVVWVDYKERTKIADKIFEFHNSLDQESLSKIFVENRKLWEDKLRLKTYFKTLFKYIDDL